MSRLQAFSFSCFAGLALAAFVFAAVRWVPVGEYPGEEFFDLAAQTIPILLVALAVEAQARRFDLTRRGKFIRVAAVVFLSFGEIAAVLISASLFVPRTTFTADLFVVVTAVGLLGGFIAVILVALSTPASAGAPAEGEPPRSSVVLPDSAIQARAHRSGPSRNTIQAGVVTALVATTVIALLRR